ncbi:class I SAM-dependent methyltransferase [Aliamphritea spongicola]|uniref:class I SAM-dependent methyltransferase n=1 Tax=Aliamphritea spongicola TaxID=707589 RepID=UPI001FB00D89|nr:class I SAM-dependent methyltransferase [Aliamphritea spongicola]
MPSSKKARQAVLQLSADTGTGPVYELGSGWGNLLIPLARQYPERKIVGYELSLVPWLTTLILIKLLRLKNVELHRQNFLKADLSEASVLLCYLFPEGMQAIADRLAAGHMTPQYLISNNFSLPSHHPVNVLHLTDFYKSPVYLYKVSSL